ncbi:hypothetical protein L7F22_023745 [Adiantum nelumboides]|nr:hypothetical protein [Adiantum nelumboides]
MMKMQSCNFSDDKVEYTSDLKKAEDLVLSTISSENRDETLIKERAKIHKNLADKMGMVLNILDPKLGDQWLDRIFALKFDSHDSVITIAKLRFLANSEMREEKRWLAQEYFLEKIEIEAIQSFEDLKKAYVLGTPLDLPQDYLLQDYLEGVKLEARKYVFAQVRARVQAMDARAAKKVEGPQQRKRNEVIMAAYRVVFRYLCHLVWEKKLTRLPDHCKGWIDRGNEEVCMYPSSIQGLSNWEIENCPWWLDLGGGYVLAREKELYKVYSKKDVVAQFKTTTTKKNDVEQEKVDNSPPKVDISPPKDQVDQTSTFQGDQSFTLKAVIPFVFLSCPMNGTLFGKDDVISYGYMVGDYLSMGQDFVAGKRNDAYKTVRDFFTKLAKDGSTYTRNKKAMKWACGMVFIDFPTGCFVDKESTSPTWNVLTEAHICLGITIVAASMGDNGWLVLLITLTGDALSWLEKYIHVLGLEVVKRVILYDKLPCGYEKKYDTIVSIRTSLLVFARRTGCCPSMFLEESSSHFHKLQIDPLSDLWVHFLLERNRLTKPSFSTTWCGGLQRSPMFLLYVLELLCPPSGLALEMGCSTAPLMRASKASSRPCFSFDIDETMVNDVVLPLVQELNGKRACLDEEESLELVMPTKYKLWAIHMMMTCEDLHL